jgi:hypothetical protein
MQLSVKRRLFWLLRSKCVCFQAEPHIDLLKSDTFELVTILSVSQRISEIVSTSKITARSDGPFPGSFRQPVTPNPDKIRLRGRPKALDLQLTNESALFAGHRIATLRQELPHRGGVPAGPN